MNNKDLISQYVDTGLGIPRYQFDKLSNNDKKTYLRKIYIGIKYDIKKLEYYYGELPEDKQLEIVSKNGMMLKHIDNPSLEVQFEAIKQNGDVLRYIPNPSEKMKLLAIKDNGFLIMLFSNPSEELQMKAFYAIPRDNDFDLRYWVDSLVDNGIQMCDDLQLELIKLNPSFMGSIKNQSEAAQMLLVRKAFEGDKALLRYLKEPTDNVLGLYAELKNKQND